MKTVKEEEEEWLPGAEAYSWKDREAFPCDLKIIPSSENESLDVHGWMKDLWWLSPAWFLLKISNAH